MYLDEDIHAKSTLIRRILHGLAYLCVALGIGVIVHWCFPTLNHIDVQFWAETITALVICLVAGIFWFTMKRD